MTSHHIASRDSSSDSDTSEWAVVDEDSSLEWNDEAKYHFRRSKVDAVVPSNDGSDEDSIEVVSDVELNEGGEEDADENLEKMVSVVGEEEHASEGVNSPNMVWYRLSESKTCNSDCKSFQQSAPAENLTAVNPRDNWDLVVILVVALIGGVALGYFWGLRHEHAATSKTLTTKLQFENNILRHKLRCMYLTLKYRTPTFQYQGTPEISNKYQVSSQETLNIPQYEERLETNILPLEQLLSESFAQGLSPNDEKETLQFEIDLTDSGTLSESKVNCKEADISIITGLDDEAFVSVEENADIENEDLSFNTPQKKIQTPQSNPHLKETITKAFALLSSGGKFWVDTNDSLSRSLDILENIGHNLQAIDSIHIDKIPPTLYAKYSSIKLQTHKAANKLVNKIDKYVHKLSTKILQKLQKYKSRSMKNFCNLKQIGEIDNEVNFKWPDEMVRDCDLNLNLVHQKDSRHGTIEAKKSSRKKETKSNYMKNQFRNREVKTSIKNMNDRLKTAGSNVILNAKESREKIDPKVKDGDDLFLVDYMTSNVSGEWAIEMAKGRAEKRENDHQSDWLFERAQARKCHRADVNTNTDGNKQPEKKFKKVLKVLHDALPTSFVHGIKSFQSAFKELRNKVKYPNGD